MNLFHLLVGISGLSHQEAADYLGVSRDTVNSWSASRHKVPTDAITKMAQIIGRMQNAVDEAMDTIDKQHETPTFIELGICTDDHEAQTLGWLTASIHRRVIGMVAAQCIELGHTVEVVPRGTTIATATAIAAHNK